MKTVPVLFCSLMLMLAAGAQTRFESRTICQDLQYGYQLTSVDLNGDGRKDLIAVDERAKDLAWFQSPGWERHILARDVPRAINIDCWDYDGDGIPECALGYHFETNPEKSEGNLVLLKSGGRVVDPWTPREIDRVPTVHRLRWLDPTGSGKKLLVVSPLVGLQARAPLYEDFAPVYAYIPGEWKRETAFQDRRGILHAVIPVAWKGKGQGLLTAGFDGLHLYSPSAGFPWKGIRLHPGDPRPCPECGSSEARMGTLGKKRFLAAIEPWHGSQVVVYQEEGPDWKRTILDTSMVNGHALATGDVDGDGRDEIVAGFRGKGYQLYLFKAKDSRGAEWVRTLLDDGGIAAADCKVEDFTGDRKPDIVCIGASTANLKMYVNLGPASR